MADHPLHSVLRRLRKLGEAQAAGALPDRDLLGRFAERGDQAAFAALVERHGPRVLGVCRRVLRHAHDAEDAFQATFLVLARKAGSVRKKDSLGSWLHGVAYHVAANLRRDLARRGRRQVPLGGAEPAAAEDVSWREVRAVLDEEVARLPERFRAPLLLCYLEGKTRDEAARCLGWRVATLRGRLERARKLLRGRLTRRGLGLSAVLLAGALGPEALAAVPAALVRTTAEAAGTGLAGRAPAGVVSARVVSLTQGVLQTMWLSKLRTMVALCLVAGAMVLAWGLLARGGADGGGSGPAGPAAANESPKAPNRRGEPGPKEGKRGGEARPRLRPGQVPLGYLGQPLGVYLTVEGKRAGGIKTGTQTLLVETVNGRKLPEPVAIWVENVRELPEGKRIVLKGYETGKMIGPVPAAIQAAQDRGEEVLLPQMGWQWHPYFVVLVAVQPRLQVREMNHGFKISRPRGKTSREEGP